MNLIIYNDLFIVQDCESSGKTPVRCDTGVPSKVAIVASCTSTGFEHILHNSNWYNNFLVCFIRF